MPKNRNQTPNPPPKMLLLPEEQNIHKRILSSFSMFLSLHAYIYLDFFDCFPGYFAWGSYISEQYRYPLFQYCNFFYTYNVLQQGTLHAHVHIKYQ